MLKVVAEPCRDMYLDLLKRTLLGLTYEDASNVPPARVGEPVRQESHNSSLRATGRDWPSTAHSMIGVKRMDNLRHCVESVLRDEVPGDFIETGVWRGGGVIFMRGLLKAYGVTDRLVWVADSFQGLPAPDPHKYPHDKGMHFEQFPELAVSVEEVQRNFERYGMLDDQVRFLKGWFRDTLPTAPVKQLAIMRLDGDLYESTWDALTSLYPRLSAGGYVIIDDYSIPACRQAVHDFREAQAIADLIEQIDWTGVFWRKAR
jgi:hypothetical protein